MELYVSSKKAFDYFGHRIDRENFFILSDIDSSFMKKHHLTGSVKDFKAKVRLSMPFTRVKTGSAHYNFRSTPVYRVNDFKNN